MNDVLKANGATWAHADGPGCLIARIKSNGPGAKGYTKLSLEHDIRTDMINVHIMPSGEWIGELDLELWTRWGNAGRYDVLQDMLTWPQCERGEPKAPPNDEDVVANLATLCRTLVSA